MFAHCGLLRLAQLVEAVIALLELLDLLLALSPVAVKVREAVLHLIIVLVAMVALNELVKVQVFSKVALAPTVQPRYGHWRLGHGVTHVFSSYILYDARCL